MALEIWTEKYRPVEWEDIAGQEAAVSRIRKFVEKKSLPNMLFAGPAGIGKTTTSLIIAKKLFGERWKENFLELNASDERGIDVVRHKVKDFARTKSFDENLVKIIYLDEADALTPEAQQALRRTMEKYSSSCRFILSCNYSSRIIEPIQSRCAVFRFRPLENKDVVKRLKDIVRGECIKADEKALEAIAEISLGDMRKAENILQAAASIGDVTEEGVYETAAMAKPEEVREMLDLAIAGRFAEARKKLSDLTIGQGLSGEDIIKQVHRAVMSMEIADTKKVVLIEKIGEYEFRMSQGGNDFIQLEALLASFAVAGKE